MWVAQVSDLCLGGPGLRPGDASLDQERPNDLVMLPATAQVGDLCHPGMRLAALALFQTLSPTLSRGAGEGAGKTLSPALSRGAGEGARQASRRRSPAVREGGGA